MIGTRIQFAAISVRYYFHKLRDYLGFCNEHPS